jgi:hypothetical protein
MLSSARLNLALGAGAPEAVREEHAAEAAVKQAVGRDRRRAGELSYAAAHDKDGRLVPAASVRSALECPCFGA